jgi:hypothetical protein
MKIRLFGSKGCKECGQVMLDLCRHDMQYEFIDALADETQKLCDDQGVNKLPHLQVLDSDGKVTYEKVGYVLPAVIRKIMNPSGE